MFIIANLLFMSYAGFGETIATIAEGMYSERITYGEHKEASETSKTIWFNTKSS